MFERYTEKARRVVFYARYEASQFGTPYIEVDQLLLALLREDKPLFDRLLNGGATERQALDQELRALRTPGMKSSTSVDLPLSHSAKRVLAYGAEEAERLGHKHIDSVHLLLAVMREPSLAIDVLSRHDLELEKLRSYLVANASEIATHATGSAAALSTLQQQFRPLTIRLTSEIEPAPIFRLP